MFLLETMEGYLGPIDGWPTDILIYLFTDRATPARDCGWLLHSFSEMEYLA